jgi:hypothetical protein
MYDHWTNQSVSQPGQFVRIPLRGGEVFVSADRDSPAAKGLQADLNAAANIGLKALVDPDWLGRWWFVPCDLRGVPIADRTKGSACVSRAKLLPEPTAAPEPRFRQQGKGKQTRTPGKDVVNLWRDVAVKSLEDAKWQTHPEYWNWVEKRVVDLLAGFSGIERLLR